MEGVSIGDGCGGGIPLIPAAVVEETRTVMATAVGLTVKAGWHTVREIPQHCTTSLNYDAKSG